MKMDCSAGFDCDITVENKTYEEKSENDFSWGILATDNDNWHVTFFCGTWMGSRMTWLAVYGKEMEISNEYIQQARDAVQAKLPGYLMGWPMTKKSVQGDYFGGSCSYDWDW